MQCNNCFLKFSNKEQIERHLKICEKYKYVKFVCQKCMFTTSGDIKIINKHISECKEEYVPSMLEKYIDDLDGNKENKEIISILNHSNDVYPNTNESTNESTNKNTKKSTNESTQKITELEKEILILKTKLYVYMGLLEKNTQIKTEQIFSIDNGKLVLDSTNLPIVLKNSAVDDDVIVEFEEIKEPNKNILPDQTIKKKKGKIFRPLKQNTIKPVENIENAKPETIIQKFDREKQEYINSFKNLEDVQELIEKCIIQVKTGRNYNNHMSDMSKLRFSTFGKYSLPEYQKILEDHFNMIKEICYEKNYNDKKLETVFKKGLTNLEYRLMGLFKYYTLFISPEDINMLEKNIIYHTYYPKEFIKFDYETFYTNFYNYGSVLLPIKKLLEIFLINPYGFNNIVYIQIKTSTDDDPFSYYMLDDNTKTGKRKWSMISRLEDFATQINISLLPYFISVFRKLYKDIFGDNDYRENFINTNQVTECDCEQLFQNILFIARPNYLRKYLCKLIKEKATYYVNDDDTVNLYGNDPIQKKRLKKKDETDLADVVKQIFDSINSEQAVDFYRSRVESDE